MALVARCRELRADRATPQCVVVTGFRHGRGRGARRCARARSPTSRSRSTSASCARRSSRRASASRSSAPTASCAATIDKTFSFPGIIGETPGDPARARRHEPGRRHRRDRPDPRRVGHGQGTRRAGAPPRGTAPQPAVRPAQLRGARRGRARERALRPRARRVHRAPSRAARGASRRPTAGRCSSTRWATCRSRRRPSSCARSSRARSCAWAATIPLRVNVRLVAATNQRPREGRRRGAVPRGPLLPAARRDRRPPAAAGAPGRPARASRTTSCARPPSATAAPRGRSRARPSIC